MENKIAITALAALAQDTRLTIFRLLVQAGSDGMVAGALSSALNLAPSSLSFHLKELTRAGLIRPTPSSRFIVYAVNFEQVHALLNFLTENCCNGNFCPVSLPSPKGKS